MGSETSKPLQPPSDWERNGDDFNIISPTSDISNPSDIHRVYHSSQKENRRGSSVAVTKAVTSHNPHSNIPAPSNFYFEDKQTKGIKKMIKKSKKAMAGCFVNETSNHNNNNANNNNHHHRHHRHHHQVVQLQPVPQQQRHRPRHGQQKSLNGFQEERLLEHKLSNISEESMQDSNGTNYPEHALHQEDAYFDRLGGYGCNNIQHASPYVSTTNNTTTRLAVNHQDKASPITSLFLQQHQQQQERIQPREFSMSSTFQRPRESTASSNASSGPKESSTEKPTRLSSHSSRSTRSGGPTMSSLIQNTSNMDLKPRKKTTSQPTFKEGTDDASSNLSYGSYGIRNKKNTETVFRATDTASLRQVATLNQRRQSRTSYGSKSTSTRSSKSSQGTKVSKLESLFRPVLPALSADDATTTSYDPFEIKVTESAPSQLESYPKLACDTASTTSAANKLALISPSMLSIDSQTNPSPSMVKVLLSNQAVTNGEFLFAAEYGKGNQRVPNKSSRDSAVFSIDTLGARSRLSLRSAKAVAILPKQSAAVQKSNDHVADSDDTSKKSVRFSGQTFDIPAIESKISDLSDDLGDYESRSSPIHEETIPEEEEEDEELEDQEDNDTNNTPEDRVRWAYTVKDGRSHVTPFIEGASKSMKNVTNSPHVRYQAAKDKWESQDIDESNIQDIYEESEDQTDDVSDLGSNISTSNHHRLSAGSGRSKQSAGSIPKDSVIQVDEQEDNETPATQVHWSYSSNGVTPHLNKSKVAGTTKSPMNRFKLARSKFGAVKELPIKSPRAIKLKRKGAGGVVTAKIEALDRKVIENRRMKRKRKKKSAANPRRFGVISSNYIRTQKINGYQATRVDMDKRNLMGAAKFNKLPDYDDDDASSVQSSVFMEEQRQQHYHQQEEPQQRYPHDEDQEETIDTYDEESMAEESMDTNSRRHSVGTISTVLQEKRVPASVLSRVPSRVSEGSYSTRTSGSSESSGLSRVKKQVFNGNNRYSLSSNGTTLSSIIDKENQNYLPFRSGNNTVNPVKQQQKQQQQQQQQQKSLFTLPETLKASEQPSKWRSLAAAAQEKDSHLKGLAEWKARQQQGNSGSNTDKSNRTIRLY
jgi:hypothetical protein